MLIWPKGFVLFSDQRAALFEFDLIISTSLFPIACRLYSDREKAPTGTNIWGSFMCIITKTWQFMVWLSLHQLEVGSVGEQTSYTLIECSTVLKAIGHGLASNRWQSYYQHKSLHQFATSLQLTGLYNFEFPLSSIKLRYQYLLYFTPLE